MTLELFITILIISATATSIAIEIIKSLLKKANITYKSMPIAVIISFIIGVVEIFIYTINNGTSITYVTILYAVCMGVANVLGATTSYDTVKSFILSLFDVTL